MSAPSSSGRWKYGEANVLSTTSSAWALCAISATAAMSVSRMSGLLGVSASTSRVSGRIASATRWGSRVSMYVKVSAKF